MNLDDRDYIWLTLCGECRGEPVEGQVAVACVIMNRAINHRKKYEDTVKAPLQFSCWNKDNNPEKDYMELLVNTFIMRNVLTEISEEQCRYVVNGLLMGKIVKSIPHECENYVTVIRYTLAQSRKAKEDEWILKLKPYKTIGNHIFLV